MKKLLFTTLLLAGFQLLLAQSNMKITTSTNFIVSGNTNVVMDTGDFVNDGQYIDSTGTFVGKGGINFNGTGTTRFRKLRVNNTQHTTFNSTVSVYDTADLESGSLDANNNLYLRSDVNLSAHMIVSGILTDHVKGIVTFATPTVGSCPSYVSALRLNISGPHMTYQWQSAPDSATWTDVPAATGATYTATVTATIYYRCHLHTDNSSYDQFTPGRKLVLPAAPSAGIISGPSAVNEAANISLTNSVPGGTWTADNSNATVSSTGLVTGVTAGTVTISYTVTNACGSNSSTKVITVNTATAGPITGTLSVCAGATTTLGNATPGGTWSSTNAAVATVNATNGIVFGLSPGTTTIAYTIGSVAESVVVTVNAAPFAGTITGASSVCTGAATLLSASGTGGVWSSSNPLRATVDASGIVSGLSTGSLVINYTVTNSCGSSVAAAAFMVNPVPSAISGQLTVCPGSLTTLTNSPAGGAWSSPDATVSVNPTNGKVTGVSPGIALIQYALPTGCSVTAIVTVNPHPGPISGTLAVCPGSTTNLTNAVSGGTWVSNNTTRAIIDINTGAATGISPGNAVITYYAGAGCFTHSSITVNAAPGAITGSLAICTGTSSDLNSTTSGGVWSSSDPAIATVNATNGIVTSVAGTGTAMITYTVAGICPRSAIVTVSTASPNTGDAVICLGQPVAVAVLSNATPGGVWSSSNTGRAVISGSTGVMNGVSTGIVTIYYTLNPGCFSTTIVTVSPAVAVILGSTNVCPGASTTLNCSTPGGTWITSDPSIANAAGSTGTISGVAQGAATVTYQVSSGCYRSTAITVPAPPTPIAGTTTICQGSSTTFTSAPAGGTWSVSNITIATITSGSGQLTGVTTGSGIVSYRISSGCSAVRDITINPAVAAITGTANICPTATTDLNNSDAGGTWTSSNTARATVDVLTGVVTGISAGTSVITYATTPACYRTTIQTILTAPSTLAGPSAVCEDANIILASGPSGGTWSSSNTAAASVSTSGTVRGIAAGNSTIIYQLANGCSASRAITVNGLPSPVAGTAAVCVGAVTSLSVSPTGGTWSSSNVVKATVDPSLGIVTGLTPGTTNISYTLPNGCLSKVVATINATPVAITGAATMLQGTYAPLSCATPGGAWSSSNLVIATINGTSGVVYGVSSGTVSISYTLASGCATQHDMDVISARPDEGSSGNIGIVAISIYPNPTSGSLTVESPGAGAFTVHTIDGKLVAQFPVMSTKSEISLPKDLAPGTYLCYFVGIDGTTHAVKLIYQP